MRPPVIWEANGIKSGSDNMPLAFLWILNQFLVTNGSHLPRNGCKFGPRMWAHHWRSREGMVANQLCRIVVSIFQKENIFVFFLLARPSALIAPRVCSISSQIRTVFEPVRGRAPKTSARWTCVMRRTFRTHEFVKTWILMLKKEESFYTDTGNDGSAAKHDDRGWRRPK